MEKINKILTKLSGKKTYIVGILAAVYGVLVAFGIVDLTPEQYASIDVLILALFGITLRAGIARK